MRDLVKLFSLWNKTVKAKQLKWIISELANIQSHWKNWKPPKINGQALMKQWDLWSVILFIWLGRVLVAGCRIINLPISSLVATWELSFASRGILVPWPGIEPRSPALGVWSLSHWTTRDVPQHLCSGLPSFPRWLTYSFIFLQLVGVFFFWHMRLPARWTWKVIWKALAL